MQIRHMTATFGKLSRSQLELRPGLNLIYAPNESGKSTWCHFLRTMLYGFPQRERGPMADKNRFAPWDGTPMSGTMDVTHQGQHYTIHRTTERPNAPMGAFSCTYTGTATAVPGIDSQNVGERLIGVERSVFSRSAFIGQSRLTLDQDAALERRMASLITTGEEDVSFSETQERLKKQLNRRRHNKTGLLPALEQEIAQLEEVLGQHTALTAQLQDAQIQLEQTRSQMQDLQRAQAQWQEIQKQEALRHALKMQAQADAAHDLVLHLEAQEPNLPSESQLAQLQGMADALQRSLADSETAGRDAAQAQAAAVAAQTPWQQHPLYPADEAELAARAQEIHSQKKPFSALMVVLSLVLGGGTGAGLWLFLSQPILAAAAGIAVGAAALLLYYIVYRNKSSRAASTVQAQQDAFQAEAETYLQLRRKALAAAQEAERSSAAAHGLQQSCRESLLLLLSRVQPFAPRAMSLTTVNTALRDALERRRHLEELRQQAEKADFQARLVHSQLPPPPLPAQDAVLPRPIITAAQVEHAMPLTLARQQAAQSRVDALTGQLHALGARQPLEQQLKEKEAEHQRLQHEYDAIAMAMASLETANLTLQNRFSPALGQHAAEIFSALTGGRYEKVVMDRTLALSAQPEGDPLFRSIQLLSQGTADQLYLAVRLAVCDMVLPGEDPAPLILDDALANFDDERLAAALEYLVQEGQHRQILLFTCQKREGAYLAHRPGITHLTL